MTDVALLDREMYAEAEAARLLRVAQSTLHYWLEGGKQRGKTYRPIIRPEATGQRSVTWAEFVEAGLLREYANAECRWPSFDPSSTSSATATRCHTRSLTTGPSSPTAT